MIKPPPLVISIDPGLRVTGVAVFEHGVMVRAGLVKNPEKSQRGPTAWRTMAKAVVAWVGPDVVADVLVLEGQQVYRGNYNVDPANLLELAGVNGGLSMGLQAKSYVMILPRLWKRQISQHDMVDWVQQQLTEAERATFEPCAASLFHNVAHAAGLGLWQLGRLDTTRAR